MKTHMLSRRHNRTLCNIGSSLYSPLKVTSEAGAVTCELCGRAIRASQLRHSFKKEGRGA